MDFDKLYPNRFLKAGEFEGKSPTLTIKGVKVEELEGEKGAKKKGVVSFVETPRDLVLNRTNGEAIKAMFGRETDAWIGKRVTFFPATITDAFTGELILAIRVKGSPDIAANKSFTAKIGRKQVTMTVIKTGTAKAAPKKLEAVPEVAAEPPPISDEEAASIQAAEGVLS